MYAAYRPPDPQPLYPSTNDPEVNEGSKRYVSAAPPPPSNVLQAHFSATESSSNLRYNPLNKTRPRSSALLNVSDAMAMHLLVETAIYDSSEYEVLSYEEVEALKKEHTFLANRIDAAKRKLALESKVRDAALSLSRLYSKKGARHRKSSSVSSNASDVGKHTDDELVASSRKCEELAQELWSLTNRATEIQRRLLQHSAGVLGMTHSAAFAQAGENSATKVPGSPESQYTFANGKAMGSPVEGEFDERHLYRTADKLEEFGDSKKQSDQSRPDSLSSKNGKPDETVQRLEHLNSQLSDVLVEASEAQGLPAPPQLPSHGAVSVNGVREQLALLDESIQYIRQYPLSAPKDPKAENALQELEEQDMMLNDLWQTVTSLGPIDSRDLDHDDAAEYSPHGFSQKVQSLVAAYVAVRAERDALGQDLEQQRRKLEDEAARVSEKDGDQLAHLSGELAAAGARVGELTTVLATKDSELTMANQEQQKLLEDFRKLEFEYKVKNEELTTIAAELAHERETGQQSRGSGEEVAALAAEVQSYRESEEALEAKIREKEDSLLDLQNRHDEMKQDHDLMKAELDAIVQETDGRVRNLEEEMEELRKARVLSDEAKFAAEQSEEKVKAQLVEQEQEIRRMGAEIHELSGKLAEMSMELTMAKAELDAAYGSRQQRQAESAEARAAAEALARANKGPQSVDAALLQDIEELARKNEELTQEIIALKSERAAAADDGHLQKKLKDAQAELKGMREDFENMTKQSIEFERERGNLESLIDQLRAKNDELETQLAEEKIRMMGAGLPTPGLAVRRPSAADPRTPGSRRDGESTSTTVLKTEFKKMMRDMRAEQSRALRAEQEERRKLEARLRDLKKERMAEKRATAASTPSVSVA